MTDLEILNTETVIYENSSIQELLCSVNLIQKCNFNDSYLLEYFTIFMNDIAQKPITWFNAYGSGAEHVNFKIAIAGCIDNTLILISDKNGKKELIKSKRMNTLILTDNYSDSEIISFEIFIL